MGYQNLLCSPSPTLPLGPGGPEESEEAPGEPGEPRPSVPTAFCPSGHASSSPHTKPLAGSRWLAPQNLPTHRLDGAALS